MSTVQDVIKEIRKIDSSQMTPRKFLESVITQLAKLPERELSVEEFVQLQQAMKDAGCKQFRDWYIEMENRNVYVGYGNLGKCLKDGSLLAGADIVSQFMYADKDNTYLSVKENLSAMQNYGIMQQWLDSSAKAKDLSPGERFQAALNEIKKINISDMSPREFYESILSQLVTLQGTQLTAIQFKELQDAMANAGCKYTAQWGGNAIANGSLSGGSILVGNIMSPTSGQALLNRFLEGGPMFGYIHKWLTQSQAQKQPESYKAEDIANLAAPYKTPKNGFVVWAAFTDRPVDILLRDGTVKSVGSDTALFLPDTDGVPNINADIEELPKEFFLENFDPFTPAQGNEEYDIGDD